jgi:Tol biopolymer transport system component
VTPERWRRIEELCHGVLDLPERDRAAYLEHACADDPALLAEVTSLIAKDREAARFMSTPAAAAASKTLLDRRGALVGRQLGGYVIRSLLGVGGMGEVYRAFDQTLGREVAIKVLPPPFTTDPERRARFEREARTLATLNHPHIGAIYGVQDADGVPALVLELVDGVTLDERITSRLQVAEVLTIARQITDALEAAHDKGIVHRDLKPANIKITSDGVVKVLDFGLAKVASLDGSGSDMSASRAGVIVGTAAYMSPEQARSQPVDKRTDIWAFGCVLYEMLTGRLAFPGDTVSDTIAGILQRDPDWAALPAATPASIRRLLHRCLVKDCKRRLRDIGDVRLELDMSEDNPASGALLGASVTRRARFSGALLPWLATLTVAVALSVWIAFPAASDDPLLNAEFKRFTHWEGTEEGAEISPDGNFVAFLSDRAGEYDIWLSKVGSQDFQNLTTDVPPLAPSGTIVRKLGFSADGSSIWFNPGDGQPLRIMPLTGGSQRPFLGQGANTPAWSTDGEHVAYVYKPDRDDPMYVVDRTGADRRTIIPPGPFKINNPVWSGDDKWIYFVRGPEPQDEIDMDVWRVDAAGGSPQRLTRQPAAVNFLTMLDLQTLLYVARAEDWSGPWLWALDIDRRKARRVHAGIDQFTSVAASRDGSRVVATVANPTATLWTVPLRDGIAHERDAQLYPLPVPTGQAYAPRLSTKALFYLSAGGTADGLWKIEDGRASEIWRNADGALSEPPAVSPDGSRLAIVVRRQGKRQLSIMSADGTNRQTISPSIEVDGVAGQGTADWSPDGTRIVMGGHDDKGPALFIVSLNGGPVVRLVEGKCVNPVWSPNGELIVFAGRSLVGQVDLRVVRAQDGTAVDLPNVRARPGGYRFLPDGGLVFLPRIHALDFWQLDLATGKTRQLTRFGNQGTLRTFDITPDGTSLVFDRSKQNSDIVLINVRKSVPQ